MVGFGLRGWAVGRLGGFEEGRSAVERLVGRLVRRTRVVERLPTNFDEEFHCPSVRGWKREASAVVNFCDSWRYH